LNSEINRNAGRMHNFGQIVEYSEITDDASVPPRRKPLNDPIFTLEPRRVFRIREITIR